MELIRDCDKDKNKQAIIKALVDFSKASSIKIIGEGIESCEELKTLISKLTTIVDSNIADIKKTINSNPDVKIKNSDIITQLIPR